MAWQCLKHGVWVVRGSFTTQPPAYDLRNINAAYVNLNVATLYTMTGYNGVRRKQPPESALEVYLMQGNRYPEQQAGCKLVIYLAQNTRTRMKQQLE